MTEADDDAVSFRSLSGGFRSPRKRDESTIRWARQARVDPSRASLDSDVPVNIRSTLSRPRDTNRSIPSGQTWRARRTTDDTVVWCRGRYRWYHNNNTRRRWCRTVVVTSSPTGAEMRTGIEREQKPTSMTEADDDTVSFRSLFGGFRTIFIIYFLYFSYRQIY